MAQLDDPASEETRFPSLAPETRVGAGRFLLKRILGQGGMGVVWLAIDQRLEEPVALKFPPPQIRFDDTGFRVLRQETLRSRRLSHPRIVRIHDLHESENEEVFIAMEFVDGPALNSLRSRQPNEVFSWATLVPIVGQLCDALSYAHGENVIHRDLKPGNLMLDSKGRLKLADFGIAMVISDTMTRVSGKGISGTLAYMSPQQLNGERPQPTDDIYSLGATLYDLLTGAPPFHSGEIVHQVLNKEPTPIRERLAELRLPSDIPADAENVIMACLAKKPEQRPQSAWELVNGIEQVRMLQASPPTRDSISPASTRRKLFIAAGVCGVVAMAVAGWLSTRNAASKPSRAQTKPAQETVFKDDFSAVDAQGQPKGWQGWTNVPASKEMRMVKADGKSFVEFFTTNSVHMKIWRDFPRPADWNAFRFSVRMRVPDMEMGGFQYCGASLGIAWLDDMGNKITESDLDYLIGKTDWRNVEGVLRAPPEARYIRVSPFLVNAAGSVDFSDIDVAGVEPKPEKVIFTETFEGANSPQQVKSWNWGLLSPGQTVAIREENDNKFLEFEAPTNNSVVWLGALDVPLAPEWNQLRLTGRVRLTNLRLSPALRGTGFGVLGWWLDQSLDEITPFRFQTPTLQTNCDWRAFEIARAIPTGANYVRLRPALVRAGGTADIDDIQLTVVEGPRVPNLWPIRVLLAEDFENIRPQAGQDQPSWGNGQGAVVAEGVSHFFRIVSANTNERPSFNATLQLPDNWDKLNVSARIRTRGIKASDCYYCGAKVGIGWLDDQGSIFSWSDTPPVRQDQDWTVENCQVSRADVPSAVSMVLFLTLQQSSGTADFDDLKLTVVEDASDTTR